MTTELVIDSSVAYKWFAQRERGAAAAAELLKSHRDGDVALLAPTLLRLELANALRYAGLSADALCDAVAQLTRFHLEVVDPDDALLANAATLAIEHGLSVYDALFLALAIERGCPLVTADRKAFGKVPAGDCEVRLL